MSADRTERVFPLATKLLETLATEEDSEVCIAAFDIAKVAVDHRRMKLKPRPIAQLKRAVLSKLGEPL